MINFIVGFYVIAVLILTIGLWKICGVRMLHSFLMSLIAVPGTALSLLFGGLKFLSNMLIELGFLMGGSSTEELTIKLKEYRDRKDTEQ